MKFRHVMVDFHGAMQGPQLPGHIDGSENDTVGGLYPGGKMA
jgi:hypothetical protein